MRRATAGLLALVTTALLASAGCNKSYCDSNADTVHVDTGLPYESARRRAPDSGWRIELSP